MNILQQAPIHHGAFLAMADGATSRGVFDQLGRHVAHIEEPRGGALRSYIVMATQAGPVPEFAFYLGAVAESFGQLVTHYYAVMA